MWSHNKGVVGAWKNFTFTRNKFLLVTLERMVKIGAELPKLYPKNKTGYPFLDHIVWFIIIERID